MTFGLESRSVLFCPLCGVHVHTHWSSDPREVELIYVSIESAILEHLVAKHPRRYRWYKRTGWSFWVRGVRGSLAS